MGATQLMFAIDLGWSLAAKRRNETCEAGAAYGSERKERHGARRSSREERTKGSRDVFRRRCFAAKPLEDRGEPSHVASGAAFGVIMGLAA